MHTFHVPQLPVPPLACEFNRGMQQWYCTVYEYTVVMLYGKEIGYVISLQP